MDRLILALTTKVTARHAAHAALAAVVAFCACTTACSTEPAVKWGNPGNLNKDNLPGEAGTEALVCDGGGSGGEGGTCGVSWKNDIFPKMTGNDAWQCATANCHAPGSTAPVIDPADPAKALASLKAFKMLSRPNLSYIDTSGDPAKSSMECNLSSGCNPAMPIGNGKQLSLAERCQLHTWLACGAPNN
jgi:hypothetical protein